MTVPAVWLTVTLMHTQDKWMLLGGIIILSIVIAVSAPKFLLSTPNVDPVLFPPTPTPQAQAWSSLTFPVPGNLTITLTPQDIQSMTIEEARNFVTFMQFILAGAARNSYPDNQNIQTMGEKLLPRWFKPQPRPTASPVK